MDPFAALSVVSAGMSIFGGIKAKDAAKDAAKVQQDINLNALEETERQLGRAEEQILGGNLMAAVRSGVTVPDMPGREVESINTARGGATGPEYAPYDFGGGSVGLVLSDISREFRTTRDVEREKTDLANKYAETTGQNAGNAALAGGISDAINSALIYFGR